MMARHPDQPLIKDNEGVLRFKENKIVTYLAEDKLNDLARMPFDREDRVQLAQLIGYSLDGYAELSYVSDEDYLRAANQPAIDIEITSADLTWLGGIKSDNNRYEVAIPGGEKGVVLETVEGVYTWGIEDGRLVFRDGNREIIALYNQWLRFVKDEKDNE